MTRLAEFVPVNSDAELLQRLIEFSKKEQKKPVMYLASDQYVEFFNRNRLDLEHKFLINFPESNVVDILLKKPNFAVFAKENSYSIPKTFMVNSLDDYRRYSGKITFPCVLKPPWASESWRAARLKKAYVLDSRLELEKVLKHITQVEKNLIIQQYIPGGDREVYFHLMYYNSKSKCIGGFTGRKLRQWPVHIGQTACAEPAPWAIDVHEESVRLFDQLKYKGFGSVEFKRHPYENKLYITEPTVGRQDAQSFLAAVNGVRLSMIAYSELTGISFPGLSSPKEKIIWIDDQYDPFSVILSAFRGRLNIKDLFRSYFGKKKFRLFNLKDMRVSFYCWTIVLFDKLFKKIRSAIA